ncbi:hypothetical protein M758_UG163000 [Ceratodon purpureus]|nr:hypothetical protein M758_UG163000 [Ceratodon purpureus]
MLNSQTRPKLFDEHHRKDLPNLELSPNLASQRRPRSARTKIHYNLIRCHPMHRVKRDTLHSSSQERSISDTHKTPNIIQHVAQALSRKAALVYLDSDPQSTSRPRNKRMIYPASRLA